MDIRTLKEISSNHIMTTFSISHLAHGAMIAIVALALDLVQSPPMPYAVHGLLGETLRSFGSARHVAAFVEHGTCS